jgi:phosphatase NudJ
MAGAPIPTSFYALVVVRDGDQFLVVQEASHGQRWHLPAGHAEPGETLVEAARRETLEEAGMRIVLEGLLAFQHTPLRGSARVRAIFLARPADASPPRSTPSEHSLEARWLRLSEVRELPLRDPEVVRLFERVAQGAPVHPLDLIGRED